MGELAYAMNAIGKMRLHVLQNPKGTFSFVGSVPVTLRFVAPDGSPADPAEIDKAIRFGPRFAQIKTRVFASREEAVAAAEAIGAEVAP